MASRGWKKKNGREAADADPGEGGTDELGKLLRRLDG